MKKSEDLEKYGFDIPFTEKELSMVGRDLQFCKGLNDEVEMEGIVTNLKFSDDIFIKKGKKYLLVSFAVGNWWSRGFPTDILAPPIYSEYTDSLVEESLAILKNLK